MTEEKQDLLLESFRKVLAVPFPMVEDYNTAVEQAFVFVKTGVFGPRAFRTLLEMAAQSGRLENEDV